MSLRFLAPTVLFSLLLPLPVASQARPHQLRVYCEAPASSVGHVFLELDPAWGNRATALTMAWGLYPATVKVFGHPGQVCSDAFRDWSWRITYNLTTVQYNAIAASVRADIQTPPDYHLTNFNCADWVVAKVGAAQGVLLPNMAWPFGVRDPRVLCETLANAAPNGVINGGLVEANILHLAPSGGPVQLAANDWSYQGLVDAGHAAPTSLASLMGVPADVQSLGTATVGPTAPLVLNAINSFPSASIVSVDWGDASSREVGSTSFSHAYTFPGTYQAQLLVIDNGAVRTRGLSIQVQPGAGGQIIPAPFPNVIPAPGNVPCHAQPVAPVDLQPGVVAELLHYNFDGGVVHNLAVPGVGNRDPALGPNQTIESATLCPPRVAGMWTDLNPAVGGTVAVWNTGWTVQVLFAGVPEFGVPNANSFTIDFDLGGGTTISSYVPAPAHGTDTIIGISPGGGSAATPIHIGTLLGAGLQTGSPSAAVFEHTLSSAPSGGWSFLAFPASDGSIWIVH